MGQNEEQNAELQRLPSPGEVRVEELSSRPRKRGLSWATSFFLVVGILALLAWALVSQVISLPGGAVDKTAELAGKAREAVVEVLNLQPRVVSRTKVHYEQNSSILELAVLERETLVEHETDHSFMGSTKRLRLRGVFNVKSGFDLEEPFTATIDGETIILTLPSARILSVEQRSVEVLEFRNGIWNKLNAQDVEDQVNLLAALARKKINTQGLAEEAERSIIAKLQEKLGPDAQVIVERENVQPVFPKG